MNTFLFKPRRQPASLKFFALAMPLLISSAASLAGPGTLEQQVIDLVNAERLKYGLPALSNQEQLASAARSHAADMATDNYFTHNSNDGILNDLNNSDGTTPVQRIEAAGSTNWGAWGENIAAGQTTAQGVFDTWRASSPHCKNMLSNNFSDIGIGHAYNASSTYGNYWVQDFGAQLGYVSGASDVASVCDAADSVNPATLAPIVNLLLN